MLFEFLHQFFKVNFDTREHDDMESYDNSHDSSTPLDVVKTVFQTDELSGEIFTSVTTRDVGQPPQHFDEIPTWCFSKDTEKRE